MKIIDLQALQIFNSCAEPTISCFLTLENGITVSSSVPSGRSTGKYEAQILRDNDSKFYGLGVTNTVRFINKYVAAELIGKKIGCIDYDKWLQTLDSDDQLVIGAQGTLGVSMVLYKATSLAQDVPLYEFIALLSQNDTVSLPIPMFNVINGGMHADTSFCVQELLIIPCGCPSFTIAMEIGVEFFYTLKKLFKVKNKPLLYGDEGGLIANFSSLNEALDILLETINHVKQHFGYYCMISFDVAATTFYDQQNNIYRWFGQKYTSDDLINEYKKLITLYPIYSIEDGLAETDFVGWKKLHGLLEKHTHIFADDLTVSSSERIINGYEHNFIDGVIIKPNQQKTVTQAIQNIMLCKQLDIATIASHRSGETEDTFLADFAVGTSAQFIKAGGLMHSERLSKYNRLLKIEHDLMNDI
jgi:enolase